MAVGNPIDFKAHPQKLLDYSEAYGVTDGANSEYWIPFSELRENWLTSERNGGNDIFNFNGNAQGQDQNMRSLRQGDSFYGTTAQEMTQYLTKGYDIPGLRDLQTDYVPVRKRRKMNFSEEGDYQYDLCESGFDYPFLEWTKRESVPGISLQIHTTFVCTTRPETINEYMIWCLRAIYALESSGVDCDIDMVISVRNLHTYQSGIHLTNIRVKNEGELSDYLTWSAMLSPGSFRTLGFTSMRLHSDYLGLVASGGLGNDPGTLPDWGVEFDTLTRRLVIKCPWSPRNNTFPKEKMDTELRSALKTSIH